MIFMIVPDDTTRFIQTHIIKLQGTARGLNAPKCNHCWEEFVLG